MKDFLVLTTLALGSAAADLQWDSATISNAAGTGGAIGGVQIAASNARIAGFGTAVAGSNPGAGGGTVLANKCFSKATGGKFFWQIALSGNSLAGDPYHLMAGISKQDAAKIDFSGACGNVMRYLFTSSANAVHLDSAAYSDSSCTDSPKELYSYDSCAAHNNQKCLLTSDGKVGETIMFAVDMDAGKMWTGDGTTVRVRSTRKYELWT